MNHSLLAGAAKARREFSYEQFTKAFQNGSLNVFTADPSTQTTTDSKDRAMRRHGSVAGLPMPTATASGGTIVFTLYDEEAGSIHAHTLHTYFDYKALFYNEVLTAVLRAFPKETNTTLRIQQQITLLCELANINARFCPIRLEEDYALHLTQKSLADPDILDCYRTMSPLKKQEVIELFEENHTRRGSTWVSILQRLISLEGIHLAVPFLNISFTDERYKQRFAEFITPDRLNAPCGDGIPLIYKLLWTEKRSTILLTELIKLGMSVDASITPPPNTLTPTMLNSIRSVATAVTGEKLGVTVGGLQRTNSGLGMGGLGALNGMNSLASTTNQSAGSFFNRGSTSGGMIQPQNSSGTMHVNIAGNPTPATNGGIGGTTPIAGQSSAASAAAAKIGDSSTFFRRGSQAVLNLPPPPITGYTIPAVPPSFVMPANKDDNNGDRDRLPTKTPSLSGSNGPPSMPPPASIPKPSSSLGSEPPPPPDLSPFQRTMSSLSSIPPPPPPMFDDDGGGTLVKSLSVIPPPPPPHHGPYPGPSILPNYYFSTDNDDADDADDDHHYTKYLPTPSTTILQQTGPENNFNTFPGQNPSSPQPFNATSTTHHGHHGHHPGPAMSTSGQSTYQANSLLIEDLLLLPPSQLPPNLKLPPLGTKQYPILSREIVLFYFKHVLKARYPVMQTLLHALFDIHPLVKFSPFYGVSDLFTSDTGLAGQPGSVIGGSTGSVIMGQGHGGQHPMNNNLGGGIGNDKDHGMGSPMGGALQNSPSDFRRVGSLQGFADIPLNDNEFNLRESMTLGGAELLVTNQKHNPTSYYVSQHSISPDALPAVPQIPFPRPPLPTSDIDIMASLHPSLEMVKAVFAISCQNLPPQPQLASTPIIAQNLNSPPAPPPVPLSPPAHLLSLRDEEGCTPLLKFLNYRQILSRLSEIHRDEMCNILIYLAQQGANMNDVQLPLRILYTLLPQLPSTVPNQAVDLATPHHQSQSTSFNFKQAFPSVSAIPTPPAITTTSSPLASSPIAATSGEYRKYNANTGLKLQGRNLVIDDPTLSDSDSDDGPMVQIRGGDEIGTGAGDDDGLGGPRHNQHSPDHPVFMLPQQYVLTKQVHIMSVHFLLSIPFTNNTPLLTVAQTYNQGPLVDTDEAFLELLLLLGANPNHVSLNNDTALRIVCRNMATKRTAIPVLLNYRACARYDGTYKITNSPLYLCLGANCDLTIIRALIYRGAQVNKVVNFEPGPLFHAVNVHLAQAKRLGEKDPHVINYLIQSKANINEVDDESNETVLMKAVKSKGSKLLVQSLINGSNLCFVNSNGKTAEDLSLSEYKGLFG